MVPAFFLCSQPDPHVGVDGDAPPRAGWPPDLHVGVWDGHPTAFNFLETILRAPRGDCL